MQTRELEDNIIIGWQEWCALPDLAMPAIKVKIDTGAKTSSLHALNIKTFQKGGIGYARFDVHPVQRNTDIVKTCVAVLVDQRNVRSSSGHKEHRCVISTPIILAGQTWDIDITLTDRDAMGLRMLLGREAMKSGIIVDPSASFCHGKIRRSKVTELYSSDLSPIVR